MILLKLIGNVKKMNGDGCWWGGAAYSENEECPESQCCQMEPKFKSGHRMSALGFLAEPGLHTTEQEQPPGHLTVGSN